MIKKYTLGIISVLGLAWTPFLAGQPVQQPSATKLFEISGESIRCVYQQSKRLPTTSDVVAIEFDARMGRIVDQEASSIVFQDLRKRTPRKVMFSCSDDRYSFVIEGRPLEKHFTITVYGLSREISQQVRSFIENSMNPSLTVAQKIVAVGCLGGIAYMSYAFVRGVASRLSGFSLRRGNLNVPAIDPAIAIPANYEEQLRAHFYEENYRGGSFLANPQWVRGAITLCQQDPAFMRSGCGVNRYIPGYEATLMSNNLYPVFVFALSDFFRDGLVSLENWESVDQIMNQWFLDAPGRLKACFAHERSHICILTDRNGAREWGNRDELLIKACVHRINQLGGRAFVQPIEVTSAARIGVQMQRALMSLGPQKSFKYDTGPERDFALKPEIFGTLITGGDRPANYEWDSAHALIQNLYPIERSYPGTV